MNLISEIVDNERKMLHDYVMNNPCESVKDNQTQKSTFEKWDGIGIREYGWNNLMELNNQLRMRWQNDVTKMKVAMLCAVAAYKLRIEEEENKVTQNNAYKSNKEEIPDFIYVF